MNEWQPNSQKHEDCSGRQRRKNSAAVTNVTFHLTHRKEYQSKLLVFYSKGDRCSFWGLLHCDDRRSPWWGNCDGLQHDRICSNTVMIRINCKSYASLVVFFIILDFFVFVCFCFFLFFFFEQEPIYTIRVVAVFYSYYRRPVSLQSNREWKPSTLGMFISFPFLKIFLFAHVIITEITAFGMFTNLCLVLLLVRADSLIPKFQFQLMKKPGEKSWKWWKFVFTWHFENKMLNARIWRRKAAKSTGTWRLLGVTAPWNSVAVKEPAFHSSPRKEIKASSQLFTRRADNAISEACVAAMTGYHLDELVMICINFNGYTSLFFFCLLLLLLVFSSFLFSTLLLLLTREYINYTSVSYGRILLPYISL